MDALPDLDGGAGMDLQGFRGTLQYLSAEGEARCRYRDHHNPLERVLLEGSGAWNCCRSS
jgi:hypothetical protein